MCILSMNQIEIDRKTNLILSDPRFFGTKMDALDIIKEVYGDNQ